MDIQQKIETFLKKDKEEKINEVSPQAMSVIKTLEGSLKDLKKQTAKGDSKKVEDRADSMKELLDKLIDFV